MAKRENPDMAKTQRIPKLSPFEQRVIDALDWQRMELLALRADNRELRGIVSENSSAIFVHESRIEDTEKRLHSVGNGNGK